RRSSRGSNRGRARAEKPARRRRSAVASAWLLRQRPPDIGLTRGRRFVRPLRDLGSADQNRKELSVVSSQLSRGGTLTRARWGSSCGCESGGTAACRGSVGVDAGGVKRVPKCLSFIVFACLVQAD